MVDFPEKHTCQIITVTSLKGGVGKSTVTGNLAYSLSRMGKRTLALDCDFNIRNLDLIMGLEDRVVYDFGDAIKGTISPDKAIITDPRNPYLSLCAAPYSDFLIPSDADFRETVDALSESGEYDFIIFDTPGDSGKILELAAGMSDKAIVVTTHNPASLRAAERTGELIRSYGVPSVSLIINCFSYDETHLGYRPGILSIIDRAGVALLGIIPYSEAIQRYQEEGILIGQTDQEDCKAALQNIAARLCGEDVPLFNGFAKTERKRYIEAL